MPGISNKHRFGHARNSSSVIGSGGSKSLLSKNGAKIMGDNFPPLYDKKIEVKTNFLRRGQGRGGSPTEFDLLYGTKDSKSLSPNSKI